jgi:hypothetical protein
MTGLEFLEIALFHSKIKPGMVFHARFYFGIGGPTETRCAGGA